MSKKNKNNNVNTENIETTVEEVNTEEVVEDTENAEEVKEEATDDVPVEELASVAEEAPIEETVEEVTADVPVMEAEVVNANGRIYTEEVLDNVVEEVAPVVTDEEPTGPVDYFVQINKEALSDDKLSMVEERLNKYALSHTVTAEGIVIVGPYLTKDGAINGRKMVIRCGLKGDIVEIPKD